MFGEYFILQHKSNTWGLKRQTTQFGAILQVSPQKLRWGEGWRGVVFLPTD